MKTNEDILATADETLRAAHRLRTEVAVTNVLETVTPSLGGVILRDIIWDIVQDLEEDDIPDLFVGELCPCDEVMVDEYEQIFHRFASADQHARHTRPVVNACEADDIPRHGLPNLRTDRHLQNVNISNDIIEKRINEGWKLF